MRPAGIQENVIQLKMATVPAYCPEKQKLFHVHTITRSIIKVIILYIFFTSSSSLGECGKCLASRVEVMRGTYKQNPIPFHRGVLTPFLRNELPRRKKKPRKSASNGLGGILCVRENGDTRFIGSARNQPKN